MVTVAISATVSVAKVLLLSLYDKGLFLFGKWFIYKICMFF